MSLPTGPNSTYTPPQPHMVRVETPDTKPAVTYALLGFTVLIYLLQLGCETLFKIDYPFLIGGKFNELILQGELWRLITPVFLHGSIMHVAFNMYALFVVGPSLERAYGHWRFTALYFLSAYAGNVLSFSLSPNPSLGSSTAIFGLVAAQAVFFYQNRKLFGVQARAVLTNSLVVIAINLFYGLQPGSRIDNYGHLGGMIGGAFFAWLGGPLWKVEGLPPASLKVVDQREQNQAVMAGSGLILMATILAAAKFFMN